MWNSTIASAYGFHGQGQEAIKVFNEMEQENLPESEVIFLRYLAGHICISMVLCKVDCYLSIYVLSASTIVYIVVYGSDG